MQYFVAELKVEKIVKPDAPSTSSPGYSRTADLAAPRRQKGEVTRLVIRASTMESLRQQIEGHLQLVDADVVDLDD